MEGVVRIQGWGGGVVKIQGGWGGGSELREGGWGGGSELREGGWGRGSELREGGWGGGSELRERRWGGGSELREGGLGVKIMSQWNLSIKAMKLEGWPISGAEILREHIRDTMKYPCIRGGLDCILEGLPELPKII